MLAIRYYVICSVGILTAEALPRPGAKVSADAADGNKFVLTHSVADTSVTDDSNGSKPLADSTPQWITELLESRSLQVHTPGSESLLFGLATSFGARSAAVGPVETALVFPLDAAGPLTNADHLVGKVAVVARGGTAELGHGINGVLLRVKVDRTVCVQVGGALFIGVREWTFGARRPP